VVIPQIERGLSRAGRSRSDIKISCSVFVAAGAKAEIEASMSEMRRSLAFYASTPTYRPVLDLHGWTEVGDRLSRLASQGRWQEMTTLVTDDMLAACAVWGPPDEVADRLQNEYGDLVDRIGSYEPFLPGTHSARWQALLKRFH
jgi:alkanesulfonate monooxygenase SsuD/methylene tetrahydromethanopterin reductase-like flavin-dependent oxidoreductase (luciferase family)